MTAAGGSRRRRNQTAEPNLDSALEVMTAPELRAFVRSVLDGLGDTQRVGVVDSLVARAAKGTEGWRPSRPTRRAVEKWIFGLRQRHSGRHAFGD